MQARKILEIHQAIKVLNQNYVFMQRDTKDKFEILTDQQRSNTDKVMIQVKDLKKHFKGLPLGGDNNENRNPRNTSSSPTRNGGSPGGRMAPADAVSQEEFNDQIRLLKKEVEVRILEVAQRTAKKTISEVGESDTLLEGRANAFTVDIETKMQAQITQVRNNLQRSEQNRDNKIRSQMDSLDEKMAVLTEKFDQRFQTNEQLKRELD